MELVFWIGIFAFSFFAESVFGRYTFFLYLGFGFLLRGLMKLRAENARLKGQLTELVDNLTTAGVFKVKSKDSELDRVEARPQFVPNTDAVPQAQFVPNTDATPQQEAAVQSTGNLHVEAVKVEQSIPKANEYVMQPIQPGFEEIPSKAFAAENRLFKAIREFFSTGNVFAKVGSIILFFGVSFLLKLVADQGYFPLEMRLMVSALISLVLIGVGWRIRHKNSTYSVTLQGAGFGVFYLTVFGAYRLWSLLPSNLAIGFLIAATVFFSLLAVLQNAVSLALLAVLGGFSAPILISTGSNNFVALFSYYALLNLGILAISRYKSWKSLNLVGFVFTYGVGALWGANYYKPEYFNSIEPFLVFHFLLYVFVALQFARPKASIKNSSMVDTTLVFGVPMATFALQSKLVSDTEYGLAISAVVLGGFYITLATFLFRKVRNEMRPMVESFLASGICFTVLAVPFALSNTWTSAVWAIQGALLVWVSVKQNRPMGRYFGMLLQVFATFAFYFRGIPSADIGVMFSPISWGSLMIAGSCFFIGFQIFRNRERVGKFELRVVGFFVLGAVYWWLVGGLSEIDRLTSGEMINSIRILFAGLSFFAFFILAKILAWPLLGFTRYGLLLVLLFAMGNDLGFSSQIVPEQLPFANVAYVGSLLLAISSLVIARSLSQLNSDLKNWEHMTSWAFLLAGFYWWTSSHFKELLWLAVGPNLDVYRDLSTQKFIASEYWLIFTAATSLAFRLLANRLSWSAIDKYRYLAVFLAVLIFFVQWNLNPNTPVLKGANLIAWIAFFLTHYILLMTAERRGEHFSKFLHFSSLWLVTLILSRDLYEVVLQTMEFKSTWPLVSVVGFIGILVIGVICAPEKVWPFGDKKIYLQLGMLPHVFCVFMTSQFMNLFDSGKPDPLPFIPLFNPLDILVAFSILVVVFTYLKLENLKAFNSNYRKLLWSAVAPATFLLLTMALLRSIHHLAGIHWQPYALFESRLVQTSLSIFWGILALSITIFSHRKMLRGLWIVGTMLIVVVVLKLMIVDLKNGGSLERVISFIGTGILLLLIGYFAPIPASTNKKGAKDVSTT